MPKLLQHAGLLALVALAINGAWQFAAADVEPKKERVQWEYRGLNPGNAAKLKPEEGWELVAVDQGVLYFQRRK